jgi:hypothetical protein
MTCSYNEKHLLKSQLLVRHLFGQCSHTWCATASGPQSLAQEAVAVMLDLSPKQSARIAWLDESPEWLRGRRSLSPASIASGRRVCATHLKAIHALGQVLRRHAHMKSLLTLHPHRER